MALLPARNILDGTALPVTSQMKTALGSLRDYCSDLLGTDSSNKVAARTALGAASAGANTDITSLGAVTGVTAAGADNTTKLATTAWVQTNAVTVAASETVQGKIEIATAAEAIAGTDTVRAITPAGLRSGLNAGGTAPVYACRAWANFNGTGVVAIRASGNVSSITDNGVGDYTINFTTAMPDANYVPALSCNGNSTGMQQGAQISGTSSAPSLMSSSQIRINTGTTSGGTNIDMSHVCAAIFR